MEQEQKVIEVMRQVFGAPDLTVTRTTTANDILAWDSISHVDLLLAIEAAFGIKFKTAEIGKMLNVGDLLDSVASKVKEKG